MSCKQYHDALAEAALGAALDTTLHTHVAQCSACRSELDRLRALAGAMDHSITEMMNVEPSPGFAGRVRARVDDETAARTTWWRGWVPALAGGAAVLAMALWLLWPPAKMQVPGPQNNVVDSGKGPAPASVEPSSADKPEQTQPKLFASRRERSTPLVAPAAKPAMPEVLVSGDEWAQVVKLYALGQQGQVNAEAVTPPDGTPLEQKSRPLVIAQLQPIAPLSESLPPGETRH